MKIIKEKKAKDFRTVTLRLSEDVMQRVDEVAEKNSLSRQKLIESILRQVMGDKGFVLRVNG